MHEQINKQPDILPDYDQIKEDLSDEWTPEKEQQFLENEGDHLLSVLKKTMSDRSSDFPNGFRLEDFSIERGCWQQSGEPEIEITKKVIEHLVIQGKLAKKMINDEEYYIPVE